MQLSSALHQVLYLYVLRFGEWRQVFEEDEALFLCSKEQLICGGEKVDTIDLCQR